MHARYLESAMEEICFGPHKMAFVSGPRQVGKTTLARRLLARRGCGTYHNWDDIAFRRIWTKNPRAAIGESAGGVPLIIFDEIHKARQWKRTLKGLYDTLVQPTDIVVTGSARLNVYRKGSDSLVGRYYHFRLHPFSMAELVQRKRAEVSSLPEALFESSAAAPTEWREQFESLMRFGGFPEPFLAQNERMARLWRRTRIERVIREDLRDLSRIPELSRIEMLASLIPERVGAPLSRAALRELLEVSFDTVRRWVAALDELYYLFEIKPFQKAVSRSLRKDGKVYLWDWSEVQGAAARFENLVASHLLKFCHFATDTGEGNFDLWCLRSRDGHEIDFLITLDGRPWLPVEVKLSDTTPSPAWARFAPTLGVRRGIQLVLRPGYRRIHKFGQATLLVTDAVGMLAALT